MTTAADRITKEVAALLDGGMDILKHALAPEEKEAACLSTIALQYQSWYTRALPSVRQLLPDRLEEFIECYHNGRRKTIDVTTYSIADFLAGITVSRFREPQFDTKAIFAERLQRQIALLHGARSRIGLALSDIHTVLQAELFDDELDVSRELLGKRHLRAAMAIAGVVLERHLGSLAAARNIKFRKKNPTISDYNDALKDAGAYDIPVWRRIQHLADLRNLAVHAKGRDPALDESEQLVSGVSDVITKLL